MTRQIGILKGLLVVVALIALPASAGGDAALLFGAKTIDDSTLDFAGVDGQSQFGVAVTLDFEWPVMLAIDLLNSSDSANTVVMAGLPINYTTSVDSMEFDVGVRKLWGERFQPYAGAGLAWVQLDATQRMSGSLLGGGTFGTLVINDSGSAVGLWLNAGFLYRLTDRFHLGLDIRNSNADVKLNAVADPIKVELGGGGTQYAAAVGFHW